MGWKTDPVKQRAELMSLIEHGAVPVGDLCVLFDVSRKTAYKWLARYRQCGLPGLVEQSRAPHRRPHTLSRALQDRICEFRRRYPLCGPQKLRAMWQEEEPTGRVPAASTIGAVLRRAQLSRFRPRRARAPLRSRPVLRDPTGPNVVWTADYKGQFRLRDHSWCFPLTIADAYSRYLLRVDALGNTQSRAARTIFDHAFREYGLPDAIRTDGGVPFYNLGPASLTLLSVWWIKLGIVPERIAPGRPQQNGRHERMHRTLKAHTAQPPQADRLSQQRCFDAFRTFFNVTRPHQALGQRPPARFYAPSPRRYDGRVPEPTYPGHCECRRVKRRGDITWRRKRLFISEALIGDVIGLEELDDGVWRVFFGPVLFGHLLDAELHHGLIHVNSRRSRLLLPMSPD